MTARLSNSRFELLEELTSPNPDVLNVYKARDSETGQLVLLRLVSPSSTRGPRLLLQEISQIVTDNELLEHANIARIVGGGEFEPGGHLFVALQHVRGITLRERIRRVAPFSLAVATDIGIAIAEAVSFAHQNGVIHGALAPSRIVLSPEGHIRVTDFGFTASAADLFSPTPAASGSYRDAAASGDPTAGDDIYALGLILSEMLTGALPTVEDRKNMVSPKSSNPSVPAALEGIVLKALHIDPSVRYRDMAKLLADLQEVRDALKSGRPLTWSPLTARTARPPRGEKETGALRAAAEELEDERVERYREPPSALTVAVRTLLVIVIVGIAGLVYFGSKFFAVPGNVVVPNLVGKTVDDAAAMAKQQNFALVKDGEDYSTKWPENQIYKQFPDPGVEIKAGREVKYYRSLGPRLLTVPDLKGMTKDRALKTLQDASLLQPESPENPQSTEEFSDSVPPGVVISQSVPAGTNTPRGTIVTFSVSKGPEPPHAPEDVQATPSSPTVIDVKWSPSAKAVTYDLTRTEDGESKKIATDLKTTQYSDIDVKPATSYSYTVTAINGAAQSQASEAVLATTPPVTTVPPSMPSSVDLTPPDEGTTAGASDKDTTPKQASMRQFDVAFRIPRRPRGQRHVQFEVQDATGTTLVYDERHSAGDEINAPVQGFGNKVVVRIFLDGKLMKQKTL